MNRCILADLGPGIFQFLLPVICLSVATPIDVTTDDVRWPRRRSFAPTTTLTAVTSDLSSKVRVSVASTSALVSFVVRRSTFDGFQ